MSGDQPQVPHVVVPAGIDSLLDAVALVAASDAGPVALIGGLAIAARVSTAALPHRVTIDIDLVAEDTDPAVITVLTSIGTESKGSLYLADIKVDVIATMPVTDDDLDGLDDGQRLFLAGHRWALETAEPLRLTGASGDDVTLPVAMPPGLVATKGNAVGYPSATRRATKHGADLYDLFRLVEVFDISGELAVAVAHAPCGIARIIADVVRREIYADPVRARNQMALATDRPLDVEDVITIFETFVQGLSA